MKQPWKRQGALNISNEFYFAAPKGLINSDELPSEVGLIEFVDRGEVGPHEFWSSICRKCNMGQWMMKRENIDPNGDCPLWQKFTGRMKVKAPIRDCGEPTLGLMASIARQTQRQIAQVVEAAR
ncbi:MAG: hypothetical protein RX318_03805 [bacterium]|nr:hypothetical protein [bacterium]